MKKSKAGSAVFVVSLVLIAIMAIWSSMALILVLSPGD